MVFQHVIFYCSYLFPDVVFVMVKRGMTDLKQFFRNSF